MFRAKATYSTSELRCIGAIVIMYTVQTYIRSPNDLTQENRQLFGGCRVPGLSGIVASALRLRVNIGLGS